jgi:hypothetical protein
MTYQKEALNAASEKIVIAHINVKKFAYVFEPYAGNIYKKQVPHVVVSLLKDNVAQELGSNKDSLTNGHYFFDIATMILYVYSASIEDDEYLITYQLYFANAPISLAYNLIDSGTLVEYENRITVTSAFNIKIDASAIGTALVGSGSLRLENSDGYFNSFNNYFWEKQEVKIYSVFRGLPESNAKLIYDGIITSKDSDSNALNLKISNNLDILSKDIESTTITEDGYAVVALTDNIKGVYKSRIWGRVNGVLAVCIDAHPESKLLAGTLAVTNTSINLTGSGTSFLNYVSSGDIINLNDIEYEALEVVSNTLIYLSEASEVTYSGSGTVTYNTINPSFCRVYNLSAKKLKETQIDIVSQSASTIYELDGGTGDLQIGDSIVLNIDGDEYIRRINSIFANNIVINQSVPDTFTLGDFVIRKSIQSMYNANKEVAVDSDIITIDNNEDYGCYFTISRNFESYTATQKTIDVSGLWTGTSGTNVITRDAILESLPENLTARNYALIGGNKYEIASVTSTDTYTRIRFTTNLAADVSQNGIKILFILPLDNDSKISLDVIGEESSVGDLISTGVEFIKSQLIEAGFEDKIDSSFDLVNLNSSQAIGLIAPISPYQKNMPKLKTLIDNVNGSLNGALFLNNDFLFEYKLLDFSLNYDKIIYLIEEYDIISWSSKAERNDLYLNASYSYNHKQYDHLTGDESFLTTQFVGEVSTAIGNTNTYKFNSCFIYEQDAKEAAGRKIILSTLLNTVISIKTDLRFYDLNILDVVEVSFRTLPIVVSGSTSRYMLVLEIKRDADSMQLVLSDLGNIFHRRGIITLDSASDYDSALVKDVLKNSYITNELGIIGSDEELKFKNLII